MNSSRRKEIRIISNNNKQLFQSINSIQQNLIFKTIKFRVQQMGPYLSYPRFGIAQKIIEKVTDPQVLKKIQAQQKRIEQLLNRQPQYKYIYRTEYKTDPQVQKQLDSLKEELKQLKDPSKMAKQVGKMKQIYWNSLKKQKFELYPGKSVIFVGRTSVGKSSLLNTLFKTQLATSKMSCTKEISIISKCNHVSIFDCPGSDEYFDLVKFPQKIPKYLGALSDIYYLYDGCIDEDVINTFMAMSKKIYLVRTKCDPDEKPEENDAVRAKDYADLQKIGCKTTVFLTSRKGGQDNEKLLKHVLS